MKKTIQIQCIGSSTLSIDLMKPLQDQFKTLEKENFIRLKNQILDEGFSAPIFVWEDESDGQIKILDGHQRYQTLILMREEDYEIPQIPVVYVDAVDVQQAIRKLAGFASQYGTIVEQGFFDLIRKYKVDPAILKKNITIPTVDISKILEAVKGNQTEVSFNASDKPKEEKPKEYMIAIFCKSEGEQSSMYDELKERGFECKII